ncbi:ABC transporter ATP-binding protein [Cohnella thailandensis]|uniref:ABC transporter ATP-binding protein n=1 Tax=Cohnella thailandensis TaxID=557557 RepID=A0A841T8Q6_9BACL|nr:ABC transporter ATP-binding protein [Cohnella thailandensis]MBB6638440.1 ABC transporter ATP-binding protein [Cohnella thailandensis]MBP1977082.1 putative ABC transport system ATP-binding protein [Cohnella thailandensis]
MGRTLIRTEKLCKSFSNDGNQQHVLKNLDMSLMEGDFTVIMGSSGSGKSTLLYAISGMDKPTLGEIHFDGQEISKLSNDRLAKFRRDYCGFVFQQICLLDNMSVLDNALTSGLLLSRNKKKIAAKAKELFKRVSLSESSWGKFPSQLSGGEAQRAGIVRALINDPKIVFADEPTGALNSVSSGNVLDVLTDIHRNGQSIVMVTHDIKSALRGNRVIYLRDGIICGDLGLGPYSPELNSGRQERLKDFLAEMGW